MKKTGLKRALLKACRIVIDYFCYRKYFRADLLKSIDRSRTGNNFAINIFINVLF